MKPTRIYSETKTLRKRAHRVRDQLQCSLFLSAFFHFCVSRVCYTFIWILPMFYSILGFPRVASGFSRPCLARVKGKAIKEEDSILSPHLPPLHVLLRGLVGLFLSLYVHNRICIYMKQGASATCCREPETSFLLSVIMDFKGMWCLSKILAISKVKPLRIIFYLLQVDDESCSPRIKQLCRNDLRISFVHNKVKLCGGS